MENKNFYSKVLLFGEYGIISNSNALSIPFKEFYGFLKKSTILNQEQKDSNDKLIELYNYISDNNIINAVIDIQSLKNDVELGFQDDKLWLFQIRPFVENKNALSNGYLDSISPKTNPDEYIEMDSKL